MDAYDPGAGTFRPMYGPGPSAGYGAEEPPSPSPTASSFPDPNPVPTSTAAPTAPGLSPLPALAPPSNLAVAKRRAGAAVVLAGVGVGTGALLGGLWGAGSGLFFAGAACNAFRARQLFASDFADDRKEAIKRTVMSLAGVGLAGYLGYKAHQQRED